MTLIKDFLRLEAAGGIVLVLAAAAAMILVNAGGAEAYKAFLDMPVGVRFGAIGLEKHLLHWINDGLMALFFLLVGLEVKREVLDGELSSRQTALLPAVAAVGGMVAPALVYAGFNWGDARTMSGWAIPAATDIAFALGVLALAGSRVPASLKVFLLALAVMDDLGAIIIIALFYTSNLAPAALGVAAVALAGLVALNRLGVRRLTPFMLVGLVLWVAVLKSGVHATLAGVAVGLAIPMRGPDDHPEHSPLRHLEHSLHPWAAYGILPVFAFANAGVSLAGLGFDTLINTVTLGVALGLFVGKQVGVMGAVLLAEKVGLVRRPADAGFWQFYGVCVLTGIGFTMSLFIGTLAFEDQGYDAAVRLGVLGGTLLSTVVGVVVLLLAPRAGKTPS